MIVIVNKFKTAIRETCGKKEPVFDDSVNYTCNIIEGNKGPYYSVDCFNVNSEKLKELKDKYQWISEEEIDVPEPDDVRR